MPCNDVYCDCRRFIAEELEFDSSHFGGAFKAAMENVRQDPETAVKAIGNVDLNRQGITVGALVNLSVIEPRIRRAGAATNFIRLIVDNGPANDSPRDHCHWKMPLHGLSNIVVGIKRDKSEARDSDILDEIRQAWPVISNIIWRDLNLLLLPGHAGDTLRSLVSLAMRNFIVIAGMQNDCYDKISLGLAMHCWLYMSADQGNRGFATHLISRLFSPDDDSIVIPTQALDIAVSAVTVDAIIFHVTKILRNETIVDQVLRDELSALQPFATATRPFIVDFLNARIYEPVAKALLRQVHSGEPKCTHLVFWAGARILCLMTSESMELTDMIENASLIDVVAKGLIVDHERFQEIIYVVDTWSPFLKSLIQSTDCTNVECPCYATPEFLSAIKVALNRLYIPTLLALRAISTQNSPIVGNWMDFAAAFDVSEQSMLEGWRRNLECCNPACPEREKDTKDMLGMMRCGQCKAISYCSAACQRADWKKHGLHCHTVVEA